MTHNYNYDVMVLGQALKLELKYIGALGPKKKLARMLDQLKDEGAEISEETLSRVFGPTGLDIGSVTPEEIALSIIAEIQAVLSQREGTSLKFRAANTQDTGTVKKHSNAKFSSCAIGL
jgi:xanthine/CO dehydrogenase XdhC/CoxF family maturation factor